MNDIRDQFVGGADDAVKDYWKGLDHEIEFKLDIMTTMDISRSK
jgi:hypothetical protein